MPKVKAGASAPRKKAQTEPVQTDSTPASSILFGLVMVVGLIVAGAALLGGSLSQMEQRWATALDGVSRRVGISVERVEVIGLEHEPGLARLVRDAAMIVPGENMFRADPHLIRHRVERTQRVDNVNVYRLWPDTLMIRVDAARPTALWFDGQDWQVVDSRGRTLSDQAPGSHAGLLRTTGSGATDALPELVEALAAHPRLRARIDLAQRVSLRRWDLVLETGMRVSLPPDTDLRHGLRRLDSLDADGTLSLLAAARLDLRLPERSTLTPLVPLQSESEAA